MTTPNGSPEWAQSQGSPYSTVNEQCRRTERGANHYVVVDKDLTTPPGSCADGATYIVAGGGGAWAGHIGDLAIAVGTNASNGWYFRDPEEGVTAWVQDEDKRYRCTTGTSPATWIEDPVVSHTHPSSDVTDLTEAVQDVVGAMVVAGTGMGVSYDDSAGTLTLTSSGGGGSSSAGGGVTTKPQGRLTLTSQTPVMTGDVTGATAVYYAPYIGEFVPIYDSDSPAGWYMTEFAQLTLNLDSASSPPLQASGSLYDIFIWNNAGVVSIGAGPAWTSATARGTGAGTTELQLKDGIWTNANAITLNNGATTYSGSGLGANEATYLGTIYCTANGQTGMAFKPAAASGGTNNILGLYNAYNRVVVEALCRDTNGGSAYTYNSQTWRVANAGGTGSGLNNRISWVDGLQQSAVAVVNTHMTYNNSVAGMGVIGTALDSTSAAPGMSGQGGSTTTTLTVSTVTVPENFLPQLGFHYAQRMEAVATGTATFGGSETTPTRQHNGLFMTLEM